MAMNYMNKMGITKDMMMTDSVDRQGDILNGLVLEMSAFVKEKGLSRDKLVYWLSQLASVDKRNVNTNAVLAKVSRVISKDKSLRRDKREAFRAEKFDIPVCTATAGSHKTFMTDAYGKLSKELTDTRVELVHKIQESQEAVEQQKDCKKELAKEKKNLKRKMERSQLKVKSVKEQSKSYERQLKKARLDLRLSRKDSLAQQNRNGSLKQKLSKYIKTNKNLRDKLNRSEKANKQLRQHLENQQTTLENSDSALVRENSLLKGQLRELEVNCEYLQTLLDDNATLQLFDGTKGQFTPEATHLVMELTNCSVATRHVPGVIRAVSKLCGRVPDRLPSRQTVDLMVHAKTLVAQRQLSEVLPAKEDMTLMTDETSKYGSKYCTYIVSDENQDSYLMGLREMSDKSAATTLDTFKDILTDISDTCTEYEKDDRLKSVGYHILAGIRDTMSDRAATEKAFNNQLEDFRIRIMPEVRDNWNDLSKEEVGKVSKMHNFFCALHLLVGMADTASASILKFESLTRDASPESTQMSSSEAGTVELIRMCAKALSRGGDEKSGCYQPWKTFIEDKGDKVLFITFRGTRFNILFYIAQVMFYHWDSVKDFLSNVHGTTNRLLQAIATSLDSPLYRSCCRVLGLLGKLITSPFWRIVEECKHVLDLNDHYARLFEFLDDNAKDPIPSLLAGKSPFQESYIKKDAMLEKLVEGAEEDAVSVQLTQALSLALKRLLERMVPDQLPGGKYFACTEELRKETKSTIAHNKLPEFVFGVLDRLVRVRPNASILTNEAFLMFSFNKTGEWLTGLPTQERDQVIEQARRGTMDFRQKFADRKKEIERRRSEALAQKKIAIAKKRDKVLKDKENFTNEILYYGLWQTVTDVEKLLAELPDKEKIKALHAQLRFRQKLLGQEVDDKKVFAFSSKGTTGKYKKYGAEKLTENLLKLVRGALEGSSQEASTSNQPLLVSKKVSHKFEGDIWYTGKVISVVPGFPSWYNVKYDGDTAIYSYKLLEEYKNGDLKIVPEE